MLNMEAGAEGKVLRNSRGVEVMIRRCLEVIGGGVVRR